ncbi:MAG: GAF domain-containing protein [Chloroflexi bacterium]|nr:GAF domain-containing protein [Chloroflexota bacterium]
MAETSVRAHLLTDPGRRRKVNEDWCGWSEPRTDDERTRNGWLFVVADGVGAYGTGQEASQIAGAAILASYAASQRAELPERLERAVQDANRALWERRRHYVRLGQSLPVMTTVLVGAVLGSRVVLANVGDCRGYLLHGGRLRQITRDHTWVSEQVALGAIRPEDAASHPRGHVLTRSLGQYQAVEVDLFETRFAPGDRILLCSDGLTRHVSDGELSEMVSTLDPLTATRRLVDLANARGGQDNITVGVVEAVGTASTPVPASRSEGSRGAAASVHTPPRPSRPTKTDDPSVPRPPATTPDTSDHLVAIEAISTKLNASLNFRQTLDGVLESLVQITGAQRGSVLLWDAKKGELEYTLGYNITGPSEQPPISRGIVQQVFDTGEAIRLADATVDNEFGTRDSVVMRGIRSVLCAPLVLGTERLGVVYLEHQLGASVFETADLSLVKAVANQCAIALVNSRLQQDLREQLVELHRLRAYQENLLGSVSSAIISLDEAGQVRTFNRMAEEILGLPAAEALGQPLRAFLPRSLHGMVEALAADGESDDDDGQAGLSQVELDVRLPTRGQVAVLLRVMPLRDVERRRIGTLMAIDDLTQTRRLREARRREESEKERITALFGRYMSPGVVEQLVADPGSIRLGGTRRVVTVLFADIRGFTALSERHTPEEVLSILNGYLDCATEVIMENSGTLDKFLGDGVMAFFNAPLEQDRHVLAAVRSAVQMRQRVQERYASSKPRIGFGAGINTGEAIVGNIGASMLMNYTCIGDTVNVAARLQSEARAGEILLSGSAFEAVRDSVEVEELGSIHVKNRAEPVPVYKVVRLRPEAR